MSTNGKQSKAENQRGPNSKSTWAKLHYYKILAIVFSNMQIGYL